MWTVKNGVLKGPDGNTYTRISEEKDGVLQKYFGNLTLKYTTLMKKTFKLLHVPPFPINISTGDGFESNITQGVVMGTTTVNGWPPFFVDGIHAFHVIVKVDGSSPNPDIRVLRRQLLKASTIFVEPMSRITRDIVQSFLESVGSGLKNTDKTIHWSMTSLDTLVCEHYGIKNVNVRGGKLVDESKVFDGSVAFPVGDRIVKMNRFVDGIHNGVVMPTMESDLRGALDKNWDMPVVRWLQLCHDMGRALRTLFTQNYCMPDIKLENIGVSNNAYYLLDVNMLPSPAVVSQYGGNGTFEIKGLQNNGYTATISALLLALVSSLSPYFCHVVCNQFKRDNTGTLHSFNEILDVVEIACRTRLRPVTDRLHGKVALTLEEALDIVAILSH